MFRRHHTEDPLADRIDDLRAAVFIGNDRERVEKLAEHLASDFVCISSQTVVEGAERLSEALSRFRQDEQRPTTLRRTSAVDVHHGAIPLFVGADGGTRDRHGGTELRMDGHLGTGLQDRLLRRARSRRILVTGPSGSSDDLAAASPAQGALDEVLHAALALARAEPSVHAIALVGSCARGTPGPESDVDLVILSTDPDDLCQRGDWFSHFGSVTLVGQRQFGNVTERRLRRGDGVDIEIGLAPLSWAETHPVDAGTARVVREGFSIVFDPHRTLAGLVGPVGLVGPAAAVGPAADVRDNQ